MCTLVKEKSQGAVVTLQRTQATAAFNFQKVTKISLFIHNIGTKQQISS